MKEKMSNHWSRVAGFLYSNKLVSVCADGISQVFCGHTWFH